MTEGADEKVEVAALMDTARILTAVVAQSLAGLGTPLSVPQLRVLVMIDAQGPMNLSGVAAGLGVNASNASRTCERLVAAGLLDRRVDERDRRSVVLRLSKQGRRLVDTVVRERQAMLAQIVSKMSAEQQQQLAESLGAFVAAATDVSAGDHSSEGDLPHHLV